MQCLTSQFEGKVDSEMCSVWFEIQPRLEKNMLLYKVKRNRLLKQKEDIHPASPFHKMGSNRRFSDPKSCKFPSVPWQIRARVGTFSPLCWCQNDALRMHRQVQLHHGFLKGPRRWHMDKLDIEFYRIM